MVVIILAVLFGGMALLNNGQMEEALTGAFGGVVMGLIIGLFFLLILKLSLRPGRYIRQIEKSVRALAMSETEMEQLGREMLEAYGTPERVLSYEMEGPHSNHTPARFVVTPHFVFSEGSTPYSILVRLSDIKEIRADEEEKETVTRGAQTKTYYQLTLYTIGFYRKDREARGLQRNDLPDEAMGFFQEALREQALAMLRENGAPVHRDII